MLIISRKKEEKIVIAGDIEITILEVGRNRVRLGIKAPKHIPIQTRLKTGLTPVDAITPSASQEVRDQSSTVREFPIAVGMSKQA
jgi:hypothetical protein